MQRLSLTVTYRPCIKLVNFNQRLHILYNSEILGIVLASTQIIKSYCLIHESSLLWFNLEKARLEWSRLGSTALMVQSMGTVRTFDVLEKPTTWKEQLKMGENFFARLCERALYQSLR